MSTRDPVAALAKRRFSLSYLYPLQRYTISNILDGLDQIVVMPTGAGKSLCYQLPAELLPGVTLVVVPLLSLLDDQLRRLKGLGIACGALRGGQSAAERRRVMVEKRPLLIFSTPEMLWALRDDRRFHSLVLHHLVIDEAHCVSEWGESFRPSYLRLADFIAQRNPSVVTAFTATASPRVLEAIRKVRELSGSGAKRAATQKDPSAHKSATPQQQKDEFWRSRRKRTSQAQRQSRQRSKRRGR